jgi:hypothetical protein
MASGSARLQSIPQETAEPGAFCRDVGENLAMNHTAYALLTGVVVAYAIPACSSRSGFASLPATSPASLSAAEGAALSVTRALQEDPPLPSERTDGWTGLHPTGDEATHRNHGHSDGHAHGPAKPEVQGAEHAPHQGVGPAAVYSCPMHPDVVSDEPGRCPRCGMALEKKR